MSHAPLTIKGARSAFRLQRNSETAARHRKQIQVRNHPPGPSHVTYLRPYVFVPPNIRTPQITAPYRGTQTINAGRGRALAPQAAVAAAPATGDRRDCWGGARGVGPRALGTVDGDRAARAVGRRVLRKSRRGGGACHEAAETKRSKTLTRDRAGAVPATKRRPAAARAGAAPSTCPDPNHRPAGISRGTTKCRPHCVVRTMPKPWHGPHTAMGRTLPCYSAQQAGY